MNTAIRWAIRISVFTLCIYSFAQYRLNPESIFSAIATAFVMMGAGKLIDDIEPAKPAPPSDELASPEADAMIASSGWPLPMPANADTIRAAMLTCHGKNMSEIVITRRSGRILRAFFDGKHWTLDSGNIGERRDFIAMLNKPGVTLEPIRFRWFVIFRRENGGDAFTIAQTEQILCAFANREPDPEFLRWRPIIYR